MKRFADVFNAHSLDYEAKSVLLNERAAAAGWTVLHPGDSVQLEEGTHAIVIGAVYWSTPDLEVLDDLAGRDTTGTSVWFFNLDEVFPDQRILPGCPLPYSTPVLAEYSGMILVNPMERFRPLEKVIEHIHGLFPAKRSPT